MKRFFQPLLQTKPRSVIDVLGGLAVLVIYIYFGSHSFFRRHLDWTPDALFESWRAHSYQFAAAFFLMFILPIMWLKIGSKRSLSSCGLRVGDWRFGLKFLFLSMIVLTPILYLNAGAAEFQAEYPLAKIAGKSLGLFILWELSYLIYYIGWEFFFRGFWQLGLQSSLGAFSALALQTTASTILHIGKPFGETFSAILAGAVFGLVALRTRSVLYLIALHWYVGMLTDFFCLLRSGLWGFGS